MSTIFSKILRGEIPCHRVYEDEHVLSFLDVGPLSTGHTLVIPKEPARTMDRLSDGAAAALGAALPRICRAVIRATGAESYNLLQNNGEPAGQVVMHLHFHIIPCTDSDGLRTMWQPKLFDHDAGAALSANIRRLITEDPGIGGVG